MKTIRQKINKGIWDYRKEYAMYLTKRVIIIIWTITIFPLILIWMLITNDL